MNISSIFVKKRVKEAKNVQKFKGIDKKRKI